MEACWRAAASRLPSSLKEADPVGGGAPCASRPSSAVSCAAALAICAANSVPGSGAGALPLTVPVMRVYGLHNQFLGIWIGYGLIFMLGKHMKYTEIVILQSFFRHMHFWLHVWASGKEKSTMYTIQMACSSLHMCLCPGCGNRT